MHETRDGRIVLLVQRIQGQRWVVWSDGGLERDELATNGIGEGVVPVGHAQHVRCESNRHGRRLHAALDVGEEVVAGLNAGPSRQSGRLANLCRKNGLEESHQFILAIHGIDRLGFLCQRSFRICCLISNVSVND